MMLFSVIRASVPKLLLDDVFEQKNEIAKAVEEELEKAMSASGFEIFQKRCCLLARREEGWFSLQELLQELNQRLVKLREVEEAAAQGTRKGISFGDLRSDIQQARKSQACTFTNSITSPVCIVLDFRCSMYAIPVHLLLVNYYVTTKKLVA
ncbi:uncharacterized protein LOC103843982 [Brassica rapa]|uniref:uncharacterized protein LOC111201362 n=1 Tax=Brassica napus TaxID=3708 RepID=UPI0006AB36CA|nr:uncharacterized protein LOC111201362 [Brassica napus]XP_033138218.1 uncharacterized protein LOC103843982 [Brassica rapa]